MKSRHVQWIGILISLIFLVLLVRSLRLDQVGLALAQAQYWWLVPAVGASLISFVFRGERFRMLLAPLKAFSLARSYAYIAINYMANNVLPARAGEVLLSYVVRQREGVPVSSSLAVTVLGRVLDGLLLLVGLLITLTRLPFPSWIEEVAALALLFFGGAMVVLLWLVFGSERHLVWSQRMLRRVLPTALDRVAEVGLGWARQFRTGLLPLRSIRILSVTLMLSLMIWVCEGSVYWFIGKMFNLHFSLIQTLFTLSLANLAATIPSGPAGIGTFEGVVVIGLGLLGVSRDHAAAYALLLHVTQVLPVTIIGALSYLKLMTGDQPAAELMASPAE